MARNIIPTDDGYTKAGQINAKPGLYEGLEFRYRPMLDEQVTAVAHRARDKRAVGQFAVATGIQAAAIVAHLKEWDETDNKGNPVPITAEHVRRLPPPLFARLFDIIGGYDPGDLPEQATAEESDEYLRGLEAIVEHGSPSTAEQDAKN